MAVRGLVDIGANLTNKAFARDLGAVLARAAEAGVGAVVITGTSVAASQAASALARANAPLLLRATAGVHPHHASTFDPSALGALRALAARTEVVALGECGLDFNRNYSSKDAQIACFEAQLDLAAELGLPLFLHERDAHEAFVSRVASRRDRLGAAVVHCFTGSAEALRRYLDLDLHIGVTGWICDERRGVHLRELVREVPATRLMIETDAPYLLPRDLPSPPSSRRNEPAFLPQILRAVAAARAEPAETVAESTTRAAQAFFRLGQAE